MGWWGGRWSHEVFAERVKGDPIRTVHLPVIPAQREIRLPEGSPMAGWMRRVKAADVSGFPALMGELDERSGRDTPDPGLQEARAWLLSLWIERDVAGAAEFVASRKEDLAGLGTQFGLVLGETDAGKAMEVLAGPLAGSMGDYFVKSVMRSVATNWPREFLTMDFKSKSKDWQAHLPSALKALAAEDPRGAAEAWTNLGEETRWAAAAIIEAWVGRNPAEARRWVESMQDPAARLAGRHAWLNGLVKQDPQAALRRILEMGDSLKGKQSGREETDYPDARTELIRVLSHESAGAALEAWKTMKDAGLVPNVEIGPSSPSPESNIRQVISEVLARKLPDDPAQLRKALESLVPGNTDAGERERLAMVKSDIWGQKIRSFSSASALEAARFLSQDDPKTNAGNIIECIKNVASHDPSVVGPLLAELPEKQRSDIAVKALWGIQPDQVAAVQAIIASVPPAYWRPEFGSRLAARPEANADFMAGLPDTPKTGMARSNFAGEWGRADPATADQWVAGLPSTAGSTQAARGLMESWGSYDETAASSWANTLPPGPVRNGAALGLAASVSALEPDSGWQWAASIGDPVMRADAMAHVATKWGNEAPPEFRAAFSAALDAGGYTGGVKTKLLLPLDEPSDHARRPNLPSEQ